MVNVPEVAPMISAGAQLVTTSVPLPRMFTTVLVVRLFRFTMLGENDKQLENGGSKKFGVPAAVGEYEPGFTEKEKAPEKSVTTWAWALPLSVMVTPACGICESATVPLIVSSPASGELSAPRSVVTPSGCAAHAPTPVTSANRNPTPNPPRILSRPKNFIVSSRAQTVARRKKTTF